MKTEGIVSARGRLQVRRIPMPGPGLAWKLRNNLRWSFIKSWLGVFVVVPLARAFGILTGYGELRLVHIKADGTRINYGVVSRRVITTAFVNFVTDQLQTETSVFGDFKYHDSGVGTTDPVVGDTGIETTDGEARVAGTQTESSANVYRSVGTITYTSTKAITEHGLFNDLTAGTLADRSEFAAVNVVSGEGIEFTYDLTWAAGG